MAVALKLSNCGTNEMLIKRGIRNVGRRRCQSGRNQSVHSGRRERSGSEAGGIEALVEVDVKAGGLEALVEFS